MPNGKAKEPQQQGHFLGNTLGIHEPCNYTSSTSTFSGIHQNILSQIHQEKMELNAMFGKRAESSSSFCHPSNTPVSPDADSDTSNALFDLVTERGSASETTQASNTYLQQDTTLESQRKSNKRRPSCTSMSDSSNPSLNTRTIFAHSDATADATVTTSTTTTFADSFSTSNTCFQASMNFQESTNKRIKTMTKIPDEGRITWSNVYDTPPLTDIPKIHFDDFMTRGPLIVAVPHQNTASSTTTTATTTTAAAATTTPLLSLPSSANTSAINNNNSNNNDENNSPDDRKEGTLRMGEKSNVVGGVGSATSWKDLEAAMMESSLWSSSKR